MGYSKYVRTWMKLGGQELPYVVRNIRLLVRSWGLAHQSLNSRHQV